MAEALRHLDAGDLRQAAGSAWDAALAAINDLLVARTGVHPATVTESIVAMEALAEAHPELDQLRTQFLVREGSLLRHCFWDGDCEPRATIERRVRETAGFIRDARRASQRVA